MQDLLTTHDAAALLGVSPATVKRWADDGTLACVKTAGGHRRFARAEVERLLAAPASPSGEQAGAADPVDEWLRALLPPSPPQAIDSWLIAARGRLGAWWRVAVELGPLLEALGERWAEKRLTILEEHLASERLARGLGRICEWLPADPQAPRAMLATVEGDDHTLGLSLVELCLRELGWNALWAGRRTPLAELARGLPRFGVRLLAVSASRASSDALALGRQARALERACDEAGVTLALGGAGAWPDISGRVHDLAAFRERLLRR